MLWQFIEKYWKSFGKLLQSQYGLFLTRIWKQKLNLTSRKSSATLRKKQYKFLVSNGNLVK